VVGWGSAANAMARLLVLAVPASLLIAGCHHKVAERHPDRAAPVVERVFRCDDRTQATLRGSGSHLFLVRADGPSGALTGPRRSGERLAARSDGTAVHVEPIGRFGLQEHLTIGNLSCWR
jgi:hypothetical protein